MDSNQRQKWSLNSKKKEKWNDFIKAFENLKNELRARMNLLGIILVLLDPRCRNVKKSKLN